MTQMNIAEAKARLSSLVDRALAGDEVVIARAGKPVVRLVPCGPAERRLGFLDLAADVDDGFFFESLPEADLAAWE